MSTVIQFPKRDKLPLQARISVEVTALMRLYGLNQTAVAEWLGVTQTAVSSRLRGHTEWRLQDIERVAEGFAVHPAELLGGFSADEPDGDGTDAPPPIVRHQGLEPRTRWFGALAA